MDWKYANRNHSTIINEKNGVIFLTFPKLVEAGVRHGFSTRMGGVSEGCLGTMNLSFTRGDSRENVYENFRRIADAIGFSQDDLVMSSQIHKTAFRKVTARDRGDGILRETVPGIDGLATNEKHVPMYTSYADCVPLLFYDPVRHVAAMAHSGWRGTVARIGRKMVHFMGEQYGSRSEDIIAAIGPSICRACYEVSEDVAQPFRQEVRQEQMAQILEEKGG
ncbi:MAG: polyphenol oxidase family protein, partial [Clostridiales bacterium]|nr:polyphenol oxidase family protein [Clostridiales bacterium]